MKKGVLIAALAAAAAAGAGISWAAITRPWQSLARAAAPRPSPDYPGGHPIDAAQVTGKLTVQVMPPEVTGALELHSSEIVKTSEILATKQARITGTCAPGSAIRVVESDGSVVCQRLGRGVASVAAIAGVPRQSTTPTTQGTVQGGVGRYQTGGAEDDFLVVPVQLPDGAMVTGFGYTYWDADERADGVAYLYRTDDTVLAGVATQGARGEVRYVETDVVKERKVDAAGYGYFVYFQLSREAGANLMPIAASVSYRLP